MPTIDELQAAVVAADDDTLPVSQNGTARRVTRSQLLAGTQASLALTPGLLGRTSPGLGPPQQISIGGGLSLNDGTLSGVPRFSVGALAAASSVSPSDLVPLGQGGQDLAVDVRTLLGTAGIDVSNQVARTGTGMPRRLADWFGDAVPVEAFGAVGDGVTDDTAALIAAVASGRPVSLGPKTYRVDGQWTISTSTVLLGVAGVSTLRRWKQSGGAWISVAADTFAARDVIFDAGSIDGESWGVQLTTQCSSSSFERCTFSNATGATLGTGLVIQAQGGAVDQPRFHTVVECEFHGNACHGLWVQATTGVVVHNCVAASNGSYGICLDFNDPSFTRGVRRSSVSSCRCWNNARGISVGNYNETNLEPPRWGLANPDAVDVIVSGNICAGNSAYGISVSGDRLQVSGNQIIVQDDTSAASGIMCSASRTKIENNFIVGPGEFGIDAGGCSDVTISGNLVRSCEIGINPGGSVRSRVAGNYLTGNGRAITIFQVETDGHGVNFGLACRDVWIEDNVIDVSGGTGGVFVFDGAERVELLRNRFVVPPEQIGSSVCQLNSDSVLVQGNTLNGSHDQAGELRLVGTAQWLVVSDLLDTAATPSATMATVDGICSLFQAELAGQISFVRVSAGGTGYSSATATITGSGSGAAAQAYVRDGVVIGITMTARGSGYVAGTTQVSIVGDGHGAAAKAFVGAPYLPNRQLTIRCPYGAIFNNNVAGGLTNWTGANITVPAGADVEWRSSASGWQATRFAQVDYLDPTGGNVTVRSPAGDLVLRAGAKSRLRLCSDAEQEGVLTLIGRGSPEGTVAAPPASDYRNLDGGSGTTFYIKRSGTGTIGWFALA